MNMLNSAGNIVNVANMEKVSPVFSLLLETVISNLREALGDKIHSIYVYGSVAEGRAVIGKSDADFVIVLQNSIPTIDTILMDVAKNVMSVHSESITKIDLSYVTLQDVMDEDNFYSWGAYIKIFGLPIYGEDVRKNFPEFQPSIELVKGFNGDLVEYVTETVKVLRSEISTADKQHRIRGTSGKILRSFFMLIAPELKCWTSVLQEQVDKVIEYYPQYHDSFWYFFESRKSEQEPEFFIKKLEEFERDILPVFENGILSKSAK